MDRSRPREIRRFEQFWLIAAELDLATSLRFYANAQADDVQGATIGGFVGIGIAILLVLLVSRARIRIARIVLTAWLLIGLGLLVAGLIILGHGPAETYAPTRLAAIAAVAGPKLAALYFLWTTATTRWLTEKR